MIRDTARAARQASESGDGARAAVNDLFAKHYKRSLRVARQILRSREDSEDAVQTSYAGAFRNLSTFRGRAPFEIWVARIVRNCCLAELRRRRNRPSLSFHDVANHLPVASRASTPEALCYSNELEQAHSMAASRLAAGLRDVNLPCTFSEVPLLEVAQRLGLTKPAAKSQLSRVRAQLRRSLESRVGRRGA